jgi:predicted negative regulator of RcsB-dependent stress response
MKRTERHHLKEDGFALYLNRFLTFTRQWKKEIVLAGFVLAGVLVLLAGILILRGVQGRTQSRTLGEILTLRTGLAKDPTNAAKLEALSGKGKYGRMAAITLAAYWVEQGQLEKAQAAVDLVKSSPRDFFYYQSRDLAAQIALLKGDADGALAILQKVEDEKPKAYLLDAVLFHKAEALEKKGSKAEALALYQKVQADYAQSYFGYDASLRARKLEAAK